MASTITALTTGTGGVVTAADTSGILQFQTNNGTTALTLATNQSATFASSITASTGNITATTGNITATAGTVSGATGTLYPLVNGTAITAASTANILFTGIPSWVKRITVAGVDALQSVAGDILVTIGSGSLQTTGYVASAGNFGNNSSGAVYYTTCFPMRDIATTNQFVMTITKINGNTWVETHNLCGTATYTGTGNGRVTLSGALDRLNIAVTGGVFTSGTFNILYE